jgi:hypothetical protein
MYNTCRVVMPDLRVPETAQGKSERVHVIDLPRGWEDILRRLRPP